MSQYGGHLASMHTKVCNSESFCLLVVMRYAASDTLDSDYRVLPWLYSNVLCRPKMSSCTHHLSACSAAYPGSTAYSSGTAQYATWGKLTLYPHPPPPSEHGTINISIQPSSPALLCGTHFLQWQQHEAVHVGVDGWYAHGHSPPVLRFPQRQLHA